jgi:hypothetical protein
MATLFYATSLTLFSLAILTFVFVIRDVLPLLDSKEQALLRNYWTGTVGISTWRKRDRAIKHAWSEHARSFPKSRKRVLFASFLIAFALSLMGYPLWLTLGAR